jgi:hypothetical protein
MAGASLDIVNVLNRELPNFGVPASTVARLAGISGGRLSSYLNGSGVVRVPTSDELKLRNAWTQLKKLIHFAKPLPLDYRKFGELDHSIKMMEGGLLTICVFESATAEPELEVQRQK